jgi:chlorite dismutase
MSQTIAPLSLHGWYVLNQFFRLEPGPSDDEATGGIGDVATLFEEWEDLGSDGWSGLYRIVGGGVDCMAVHFRSSLDGLGDAERALRRVDEEGRLALVGDYVSVVELGLYSHTAALLERAGVEEVEPGSETWDQWVAEALEQEKEKRYVQRRLFPTQPDDMPYVCFYPMDKRRAPGQNWYELSVQDRADLMLAHGATGRRWAGKVSQIISGSVGLDDWEWAVTLFSGDPLEFKDLVTEMRYDEASAVYAEFGSFWVGRRVPVEKIAEELSL